ncbi:MAG: serine/threonine-protein kinase [Myxococcota bacterium]
MRLGIHFAIVAAGVAGWVALGAGLEAYAALYLACLAIAMTSVAVPAKSLGKVGPTFLWAFTAAAVVPVGALAARVIGGLPVQRETVLAATVAAIVAALAAVVPVVFGSVKAAARGATAAPSPVPDAAAPSVLPARTIPPGTVVAGASTDGHPRVDRYKLIQRIGIGGMGEVWRAEHETLARPAALKLIRRHKNADPALEKELIARFEREAQATARLTSPHTISLYDFGVIEDGTAYYAMELLEGMNMRAMVETFGPLAEARIAFLLRQACHSLIEAHDAGLVHRDIKPDNIFVARAGRDHDFVKVLDFGLVKELDDKPQRPKTRDPRAYMTAAGARPGTPGFMAPEQIAGNATIDHRIDIYALGCVAYWALTGKPVFEGYDEAQVLFAHVEEDPVRPSERLGRPVHAELEALVMRCLAKDRSARYDSAEALDEAIGRLTFETPWSQPQARAWWNRDRATKRTQAMTLGLPAIRLERIEPTKPPPPRPT